MKIAAVSYINTLPFIYGLENSKLINDIELSTYTPSICAEKLIKNEVDLGLIPVAVLPKLKKYYIVSDYCIGAKDKVDSVFLFSEVPLNKINNIILDYQSQSSNNLTKVLSKNYWKISPNFIDAHENYQSEIIKNTAGVVIGNRALKDKNKYKYVYDLAYEWKQFTGKQFVFALWISNKNLDKSFIENFNTALQYGINNIDKLENSTKYLTNNEFSNYLTNNIDYIFNSNKKQSLNLFLDYISKL